MPSLTMVDLARRMAPVAPKREPKKWRPGGTPGKLHREIGVPEGEKIPAGKLAAAERSRDPEIRRDATRAKTMEGWHHKASVLHDRSK